MKQKNLDNSVKDNERLMTRSEIIKYLEEKIVDYKEILPYVEFNSGALVSIKDFERRSWDSPY